MKPYWHPILMYHSISSLASDPNRLCTSPGLFEAQMLYLKRHGLRGVSVNEMHRAITMGNARGLVGLTFDDGYEDFMYTAMPVLERLGFSATVFVVVGMLGEENNWEHAYNARPRLKLLAAEELGEVTRRGFEVGSHSMTHPNLSGLEPELLEKECSESRRILGEILGRPVEGFAYPYGSLDDVAVRSTRRAGYAYAGGWKTRVEHSSYDLLRMPVSERDSRVRFWAKLKIYGQYVIGQRLLTGARHS